MQIFAIGDLMDAMTQALRPLTFQAVHTFTLPPTMVPLAQQFSQSPFLHNEPTFCTHAFNVANSLSHLVQIPLIHVGGLTPEIVRLLEYMPNLRQIDLIDYHYHFWTHPHIELIATAQEIL
ncbi:hypothetical protein MVEN_00017200 [Mycena venus]|uniref:Uncharacterized protein n=1 Tax=Mycena venus TaxID=2733690 RepID=A0A8H6Z6G1_9AGAR|nr:hypothetical protein MVEN_00017200 [Mycena venus]